MNDTKQPTGLEVQKVAATPEIIKAKLALELTKVETGIQALNDKEAGLVYDEDHLQDIANFINDVKKAEKVVEDKRVELKKPSFTYGQTVDAGAKLVSTELNAVKKKAHDKYVKLCKDIEDRRAKAEKERKRKEGIASAIANVTMEFSQQIAAATTDDALVAIEKRMGSEKTKSFYEEYAPQLVAAIDNLRPLALSQKQKIREMAKLSTKLEKAQASGDNETVDAILNKQEELETTMFNTRTLVQETAMNVTSTIEEVEEILPEVKTKRRSWKVELVDIDKAIELQRPLLSITLDPKMTDEVLEEGKKKALEQELDQIQIGGIRIYLDKTY